MRQGSLMLGLLSGWISGLRTCWPQKDPLSVSQVPSTGLDPRISKRIWQSPCSSYKPRVWRKSRGADLGPEWGKLHAPQGTTWQQLEVLPGKVLPQLPASKLEEQLGQVWVA